MFHDQHLENTEWVGGAILMPIFTDEGTECSQVPEPGRIRIRTCTQGTKKSQGKRKVNGVGLPYTRRSGQAPPLM